MKSQNNLQMKTKSKRKFQIERELKVEIPTDLLLKLREGNAIYGFGQALHRETDISYNTIAAVIKTGVGTPTTIKALQKAIKKLAA
jgi:hypothetical protein